MNNAARSYTDKQILGFGALATALALGALAPITYIVLGKLHMPFPAFQAVGFSLLLLTASAVKPFMGRIYAGMVTALLVVLVAVIIALQFVAVTDSLKAEQDRVIATAQTRLDRALEKAKGIYEAEMTAARAMIDGCSDTDRATLCLATRGRQAKQDARAQYTAGKAEAREANPVPARKPIVVGRNAWLTIFAFGLFEGITAFLVEILGAHLGCMLANRRRKTEEKPQVKVQPGAVKVGANGREYVLNSKGKWVDKARSDAAKRARAKKNAPTLRAV